MMHHRLRVLIATPRRVYARWMTGWGSLPVAIRRRILGGGLLLLGVNSLYLALTYEPFLTWFASRFRVEDPLVPSDALVVMLGSVGDRSMRAAELYRQGLAPVILLGQTGGVSEETEIDRQVLMQCGVPADAIRILSGGVVRGTRDEALRVRDLCAATRPGGSPW